METICWRFPPLSGGTRQGYSNNDIEAFKGEELMDNLAREICQNSLDAKILNSTDPVKVVFELKWLPADKFNVFSQYQKCINGCRKYWGNNMDSKLSHFLDDADEMLSREKIPVLIAGDYNTRGLCGSRSRSLSSAWEALTGADGISVKSTETSGGSFGIGKNAPFACSALSMVFYNTFAEDNEKAFIGVARLATLYNEKGKETQRVGRYQKNDDDKEIWTPIYNEDSDSFRDLFHRELQGTDVIVVGFNQTNNWTEVISKAILKNFFVAINEKKLVVEIKDETHNTLIDSEHLSEKISAFSEDKEMNITSQLYSAFTSPDKKETISVISNNDAEIYIKADSSFNRTIGHFRDTGMLIYLKSRRIFQHYAAVFVVRGEKLGKILRETEPARHNQWDYKRITGLSQEEKDKRKQAKSAINTIDNKILTLLKGQFEITAEDTVDAAGVGEYLPDDTDGLTSSAQGDDILKPKIKIGKIKTLYSPQGDIRNTGEKDKGKEKEGDIHNKTTDPTLPASPADPITSTEPTEPAEPFSPVENVPSEQQPKDGISQGEGTKIITTPNLTAQRAFPINPSLGLYKIVLCPAKDYENIYICCSALGEDGKTDMLDIETFNYNKLPVNIKDNKAGPIAIKADEPANFFVRFRNKEKMVLNLKITEENIK